MSDHTRITTHPIWAIEKQVWRNGITNLDQHIQVPNLLEPFCATQNLRTSVAIEKSHGGEATFKNPHMMGTADVMQLVYQADTSSQATYCCSTYVKSGQNWQLVKHARKPVAA